MLYTSQNTSLGNVIRPTCLVSKSTIPIYFDNNSSKSDGNPIVIVFATILNSYT